MEPGVAEESGDAEALDVADAVGEPDADGVADFVGDAVPAPSSKHFLLCLCSSFSQVRIMTSVGVHVKPASSCM